MMTAVRDLEQEFRDSVAVLKAAESRLMLARDEMSLAECECERAKDVHRGARQRYLDAEFYGKPFEVEQPDPAANEINAAVHAARTRVGMAAVERGIGKPKPPRDAQ